MTPTHPGDDRRFGLSVRRQANDVGQKEPPALILSCSLLGGRAGLAPYAERGSSEARWLTGEELTDIVNAYQIQFVWGVLSGFNPGISIDVTKQ